MKNQKTPSSDWTDKDWDKMASWLKGLLNQSEVNVTFTKKDGTERVMRCTLNPEVLPPATVTEGKEPRKKSDTTMAVYDLDAKGWRSFTIKSIKRIATEI